MDASYWADVFTRVVKLSKRWSSEQARCEIVLGALAEFHGRLAQLAHDPPAPQQVLGSDVMSLLRAKHVRGVENLMEAMHSSCRKFEAVHGELSDLHSSLWNRYETLLKEHHQVRDITTGSAFEQPTWSIVGAGRGLDAQPVGLPSSLELIEWVREIDAQYTAELLLKLELLETVDISMSTDALHNVVRLWVLQPHLSPQALRRAASMAESLTLPE